MRFLIALIVLLALGISSLQRGAQSRLTAMPPAPPQTVQVARLQAARLIVLTDIEADPDDTMSMVRLLTYSNQIDIEGLIAVTSMFLTDRTAPQSIHAVIDAYAQARPHLLQHEPGFPTAESLHALVKSGPPVYGMKAVGQGQDSAGSEWIVARLKTSDPRPLWVASWGGTNVLAQALWKIAHTLPADEAERLYRKLRVYTISDQDDACAWIRKNFPHVFYICSPGSDFRSATWLGMSAPFPGSDAEVVSPAWLAKNIQQDHGPLGAAYPDVAYLMEGDTPSYLSLIPNGLNEPEHPDYGGWGGRYTLYQMKDAPAAAHRQEAGPAPVPPSEPETRPIWTNAQDAFQSPIDQKEYSGTQVTIWRWRREYQNDFAARMCWATQNYHACNHPPVPVLASAAEITVKAGDPIVLDATGSHDPDGDSLSYLWFQYQEAGDYPDAIDIRPFAPNLRRLVVTAPHADAPHTVHFILKVTDKGTPPLTRYKRVIVHIVPR